MLVTVKPVAPIRGVTRNVILTEQTLDLNLFQIKKCMKFGSVSYDGTVLKANNVDEIYAKGGVTKVEDTPVEEKKEDPAFKEEPIKKEEASVDEKAVDEEKIETPVEDTPVEEETETVAQQTTTNKSKNKNRNK